MLILIIFHISSNLGFVYSKKKTMSLKKAYGFIGKILFSEITVYSKKNYTYHCFLTSIKNTSGALSGDLKQGAIKIFTYISAIEIKRSISNYTDIDVLTL